MVDQGDGSGIVVQTPVQLREQAKLIRSYGVKPEMEIFEPGMIENALLLVKKGLVEPPLHFDFVLGSRGSQPATARKNRASRLRDR